MDRQTYGQLEIWRDIQLNREKGKKGESQTDVKTDREIDRQRDRQAESWTDGKTDIWTY